MNIQKVKRFIRLNILALAICTGVSIYLAFRYIPFLYPVKYPLKNVFNEVVPWFIFTMLFIAFSRVEVRKMRFRRWHFILLALQLLPPLCCALWIRYFPGGADRILEGLLSCMIIPTAAAASVITGKLGGDESSLTVFMLLSNAGAAVGIPLIFPIIAPGNHSFTEDFIEISLRVFPMIILPLLSAQLIRFTCKRLNEFIVLKLKDLSFYIWAVTLTSISAQAVSNTVNSGESAAGLTVIALTGLFATVMQFGLGKLIGHRDGQRISAGQALGQKNMVFGIWVTSAFLSPSAAIAPGCYILWQNIVNSWQLSYRERNNISYTDKPSA